MHRNYRLVNKRRFMVFLVSVITAVCLLPVIISAGAASDGPRTYRSVKVRKGDTLWSIASAYCEGDIRENVFEIRQINNLDDGIIYEGQTLLLP
jgi:LysM domain.